MIFIIIIILSASFSLEKKGLRNGGQLVLCITWCGSGPRSGVAVSAILAAGEGSGLSRYRICRPLFLVVALLNQLCGWLRFSSSGALMKSWPLMASLIGGCLPAVCVDEEK